MDVHDCGVYGVGVPRCTRGPRSAENMINWAGNPGCQNKLDLALDPRKVPRKHA